MGIFSIGDLLTIPTSDIGRQFGKDTLVYVQALRDDLNIQRANHFYQPSERFFQQIDLVSEVSNWQGLRFPMKRLLNDLESFLYQRQKAVQHITFQLFQRDNHCTEIECINSYGQLARSKLLVIVAAENGAFAFSRSCFGAFFKGIRVLATEAKSQHFFHEAQDTQSLFPLIGKLQVKLGERAVYTPAISDDPRPGFNECRQPPCRSQAPSITPIKRPLWLQRAAASQFE